jgi:hypothetical protein
MLLVGGMIVSACSIRLPRFYQDILGDVARAIEDSSLNDDALARYIRTGDVAAEIILEDFEARLIWN